MKRSLLLLLAGLSSALCCGQPFPTFNVVDRPRVLAVQVRVPEGQGDPGSSVLSSFPGPVQFRSVVIGATEPPTGQWWRVCVPVNGDPAPVQTCFDNNGVVLAQRLSGPTPTFTAPFDPMMLATAVVAGIGFGMSLEQIVATLTARGLDLLAVTEMQTPQGTLRASKRFVFTFPRALLAQFGVPVPTGVTGPVFHAAQVPGFTFGGATLRPSTADPEQCVTSDGSELVLAPQTRSSVMPASAASNLALFADGGQFDGFDDHANLAGWRAPMEAGTVRAWILAWRPLTRTGGATIDDVTFCSFSITVR